MEPRQKNPHELGSLWAKTGKNGVYLSGTIDGIGDVVCFSITGGDVGTKIPSWRVLRSIPKEQRQAPRPPVDDDDPFA